MSVITQNWDFHFKCNTLRGQYKNYIDYQSFLLYMKQHLHSLVVRLNVECSYDWNRALLVFRLRLLLMIIIVNAPKLWLLSKTAICANPSHLSRLSKKVAGHVICCDFQHFTDPTWSDSPLLRWRRRWSGLLSLAKLAISFGNFYLVQPAIASRWHHVMQVSSWEHQKSLSSA